MAKVEVPDEYVDAFVRMGTMPEQEAQRLFDAVRGAPVGVSHQAFGDLIKAAMTGQRVSQDFVDAIYSLGQLLRTTAGSRPTLAHEIATSVQNASHSESQWVELNALTKRIAGLLNAAENLSVGHKALVLSKSQNKTFQAAQIITDMRFVFDDEPSTDLRHGMIVHSLKLNYLEAGKKEVAYIGMNLTEIRKLQQTLARALEKEEAIKKAYPTTNFLSVEEV
jgi:hypothetical protein